jgi:hypothetical protein
VLAVFAIPFGSACMQWAVFRLHRGEITLSLFSAAAAAGRGHEPYRISPGGSEISICSAGVGDRLVETCKHRAAAQVHCGTAAGSCL